MPHELVRNEISDDVVEALEQMLYMARSGDLLGLAFAASLKGRRYITDVTGTCRNTPTMTRGMVATLSDELGGMIHERSAMDTR